MWNVLHYLVSFNSIWKISLRNNFMWKYFSFQFFNYLSQKAAIIHVGRIKTALNCFLLHMSSLWIFSLPLFHRREQDDEECHKTPGTRNAVLEYAQQQADSIERWRKTDNFPEQSCSSNALKGRGCTFVFHFLFWWCLNTTECLFSGGCSQEFIGVVQRVCWENTREEKDALRNAFSLPIGSAFEVTELHVKSKSFQTVPT